MPVAAIQRGQPGTFVYLVKADDTVAIRVVETGATDGEKIAVTKGLEVGDQVVIDGVDRLRDGAKIRRRRAAAPPGTPVRRSRPRRRTAAPPAAGGRRRAGAASRQRRAAGRQRRAGGERRGGGGRSAAQTNQ